MREVGGSSPSSPILDPSNCDCLATFVRRALAAFRVWVKHLCGFKIGTTLTFESYRISGAVLTLEDPSSVDLLSYAAGRGHRDFPCLSRQHNPSSCVPCMDFSPWLRERVRREDTEGIGEYLWRVRRARPEVHGTRA